MNAAEVNSPPESGSEERVRVSGALSHLKKNDTICVIVSVFDRVKRVFFYTSNYTF